MGGAFLTSREIFDNPIWQDVQKFRIFFYIYGNAVFAEEGVRIGDITIKRGQFLRSYRNLSKDLEYIDNRAVKSYAVSSIKRKVDSLVKENRLQVEETELGTLFTVVNYQQYQGFEQYKRGNIEQRENSDGTATEQRRNNNKKVIKDKKVNKKTSRHKYEPCDMENAEMLFKLIKENNSEARKPNLEAWANELRLMREKDERTDEAIKYLINWSQKDSFWKTNILSAAKLRQQYEQLTVKIKAEKEKQAPKQPASKKPRRNFEEE
jgi:hypothetical protein